MTEQAEATEDQLDITSVGPAEIYRMSNKKFQLICEKLLEIQRADRKENNLLYYEPVSDKAKKIHYSKAKYVGVSGGNRSSKTETCLAHAVALATGVFPISIRDTLLEQFRGPINVRVVVESFTTTLHPTILPKLRWWHWTGIDAPGGKRGHYGWVPKICLKDCSWEKSWSEKLSTLTVVCRDPQNPDKILGESIIQFMSKSQEIDDYASGTFHIVIHDEPPLYGQWLENQARVMDVNGRIFLAFTWPDDPSIPMDWVYDEIYEKAQPPNKHKDYDWFELWTTDNKNLDQKSIAERMAEWSEETRRVRIYGASMRFSNRIHPLFTDIDQYWCFVCKQTCFPDEGKCTKCGADNFSTFNHVQDFNHDNKWPVIWLLDPHPRKPHMFLWAQIDPSDDIWIVNDGELNGDPGELKAHVMEIERDMKLHVVARLIDPNMGRSPASSDRVTTWQDAFDQAGLVTQLAENSDVGRTTLNEYLKPDPFTQRPRITFNSRCQRTIHQIKRYVWDDYKMAQERDVKQKPRDKNDDYPTLVKYLMNFNPQFSWLHNGAPVIRRPGKRKGAY